jgi:hypothetical protein
LRARRWRVLWTSTGSGNFNVNTNFARQNGALSGYTPIVADFNRDGRAEHGDFFGSSLLGK